MSAKGKSYLRDIFGANLGWGVLIFVLALATSVFEAAGLGMILPFLEIITNPDNELYKNIPLLGSVTDMFPGDAALAVTGVGLAVMILIKNGLFILKTAASAVFINKLRRQWTLAVLDGYLHSRFFYFFENKHGVLLNNLVREPQVAAKAVQAMIEFASMALMMVFLYILAMIVDWRVTVVMTAAGGVLLVAVSRFSNRYSKSVGVRQLALNQEMTGIAAETLSGIRQIKVFSSERTFYGRLKEKLTELVKVITKYLVVVQLPRPILESLAIIVLVGMIVYVRYVMEISLLGAVPVIGLFVVIAQRLFPTVTMLFTSRMNINTYMPALRLVHDLTQMDIESENLTGGRDIDSLDDDIKIRGAHFSYPGKSPLFEGLDLDVPLNRTTAVVGPSGSGKSTLVDLLVRFYRLDKGRVLVNGDDIEEVNLISWRRLVSYVSQEAFLFNASIRENILMGKPDAGDVEVIAAAKMANAHDFIMDLPDGYDTVVGDRGLNLSGGQRQRIAVARAVVRDAPLMIFDEATSSLDNESERLIQDSINRLQGGKTIIVISHRFSTVRDADVIHVMENGRIVESGTFDELERQQGRFYQLAGA